MPGGSSSQDSALRSAHIAFRSIARQRLKSLQAAGVETEVASSQLFDNLVIEAAPSSSSSNSSPSRSPSLQHVIACTGASVTHAAKILQLKEEIGRLRHEGHSTVSLIERLRDRLRDAGEQHSTSDENGAFGAGWRAGAGAPSSKKRRVGEECSPSQHTPPTSSVMVAGHALSEPSRLPPWADVGFGTGPLGEMASPRSCPSIPADPKRTREDGMAPSLQHLKKLKLRPHGAE